MFFFLFGHFRKIFTLTIIKYLGKAQKSKNENVEFGFFSFVEGKEFALVNVNVG